MRIQIEEDRAQAEAENEDTGSTLAAGRYFAYTKVLNELDWLEKLEKLENRR